jgi:hypothetical protein
MQIGSNSLSSLGNGVAISIPTIGAIFANVVILTNVAGVRFERQRRSLLQTGWRQRRLPWVFYFWMHNPNGVVYFTSIP